MSESFCALASTRFDLRQQFSYIFHSKQLVGFLILGAAVLLLFAVLYFQEWLINRRMRRLTDMARSKQAQAQALATPPPPRLPLIRAKPLRQASAWQHQTESNRQIWSLQEVQPNPNKLDPAGTPGLTDQAPVNAKRGRLEVCADDAACEVFVDGVFIGNVPARLLVPEGTHLVEVRHLDGSHHRRRIYVSQEADLRLQVALGTPD